MTLQVENGRGSKLRGDPSHPVTRGFLCGKVAQYLEHEYAPARLLFPRRRVGAKGEGRFERISWDEALETIAGRLRAIAVKSSGRRPCCRIAMAAAWASSTETAWIAASFTGWAPRGWTAPSARRPVRWAYQAQGVRYGTEPEQFRNARLIIAWGANVLGTNVHLWPFIMEARRQGARFYTIDPRRNRTGAASDKHFFINPGSDTALALGMMHVIVGEDCTMPITSHATPRASKGCATACASGPRSAPRK